MDSAGLPVHAGQDQMMSESSMPISSAVAASNEQSNLANSSIKDVNTSNGTPPAPHPPTEALKPNGIGSHDPAHTGVFTSSSTEAAEIPDAATVPAISAIMNENDSTPRPRESSPASVLPNESADPAVQQPVSDLRSHAEPTSEERASEIKQAKEQSDLISDRELAVGLTSSSDAPIERNLTPAPESGLAASPRPAEAVRKPSEDTPDAELPHRSSPTVAPVTEPSDSAPKQPAPTPAVPALEPQVHSESAALTAQQPTSLERTPQPADKSPIDQDWEMVDAPSPSKVPRQRDEEEVDEPATKRLKAEGTPAATEEPMADASAELLAAKPATEQPSEDKPAPTLAVETSRDDSAMQVDSGAAPTDAAGKSETQPATASTPTAATPYVRKAGRPEFDKPVTVPQKKALQKIISNLKRGQHAPAFKEPVNWEALNIPTYPDIIKHPMDLRTMETKVKENTYTTVNEFIADFDQIIINTETFNGLLHDVTRHGHELGKSFEKQLPVIPSSEFIEPPPPDKKGKRRDSAEAARPRRRESRTSIGGNIPTTPVSTAPTQPASAKVAKSPTAASPASPAFALKEGGLPQIRRGSENNPDGRPRREIHPPAPKDLPYSAQKPRKKKYAAELRFCQKVLADLQHGKHSASNWPFLAPVDPIAMNLPTYLKIVKKPMDLSTIQTKLKKNEYGEAKEFEQDVRLMLQNCFKFNVSGDHVYRAGQQLERVFDELWEEKKEWLKKNAPKSGGGSPASDSDGSDADEDEEDAEADDEGDEGEQARISQLEAQIQEMSRHLEEMRKGSDAGTKKKPRGKSTSKGGGAGAAKESTAGGSKKKATGKSDKKAGASKSKKKDNYVTYEQKQDISERINTLPPAQMNQALKVIRDNMPGLKGAQEDEIELDIDELPNEVLHKLLMFVRKYAPKPEDPVEAKAAPKAAASTKPKKNKPMGKVEQEARIKELREKLSGGGGASGSAEDDSMSGGARAVESSGDEDDDSEESEED